VLALCGVAIEAAHEVQSVIPSVDEFKARWFGRADIQLHYRALAQKAGPFSFLANRESAWEFEQALGSLIAQLGVTIFCAAINKTEYVARHGRTRPVDAYLPTNLYLMALDFVLERFVKFLEEHGPAMGRVIAESRGQKEDEELAEEYAELLHRGTQFVSAERFRRTLQGEIRFAEKKARFTGLEIADVCAAPIATQMLKPGMPSPVWSAIRPQIWVSKQTQRGSVGLKVYPRASLLDAVFDDLVRQKSPEGP
jgi:hypothetical protein